MSKELIEDLSFNLLDEKERKVLLRAHANTEPQFIYDPITFRAMYHNKNGERKYVNGYKFLYSPFNNKITAKVLYKEGYKIKKWVVNNDNKWEKIKLKK